MFERRLKVFLFFLAVITAVLVARAVQVQILNHDHWTSEAGNSMHSEKLIEATRGSLLDTLGRPIALDVASMDACVDFRAIPVPTEKPPIDIQKWLLDVAAKRIKQNKGDKYRIPKQELADEIRNVKSDIADMWRQLAREGDMSDDEMDQMRQAIVHRVEMRRRYVWWWKKQLDVATARRAAEEAQHPESHPDSTTRASTRPALVMPDPPPAIRKWLAGETDVAPSDDFDIHVSEQTDAHVILRAIKPEVFNRLGKRQERFPGLVLRSNMHRVYPFGDVACHVLGHLNHVEASDLAQDPNVGNDLRAYQLNDEIGRGGLEALCEPLLRGTRGRHSKWSDDTGNHEDSIDPKPGRDVQTTLDVDLEKQIREAFNRLPVLRQKGDPEMELDLHGAAVVIDVASGAVRAMVSVPTYDANRFDELYASLRLDNLNQPLLNFATEAALETGSTIKPVVGIGAITQGLMGINDTIECTGYLVIAGKRYPFGRCWVASKYEHDPRVQSVAHHPVPDYAPHPTGFLNFPDALERSCNIYFENMGDRLGLEGLSHWMDVFGLGRPTGIGIAEARGRLPNSAPETLDLNAANQAKWFGGMGQGFVAATPLQMANVAATLARNGVWMRPHLITTDAMHELQRMASPSNAPGWSNVPERVVLPISAAAVAAAQEGMKRVANSPAGTGLLEREDGLIAAGKTGTAQAAHFFVPTLDEDGKPVLDEHGKPLRVALEPSTYQNPNKLAPWYLGFGESGTEVKHSWYIGYAPADNPRIAFAVLVEYGGSGGTVAKHIANRVIDSCIKQGYIPLNSTGDRSVQ